MSYAPATTIDAGAIPVIDIAPLEDGPDPLPVARALHAASRNLGFIYVRNHGIPQTVIDDARSSAMRFFRAGSEQKLTVAVSRQHRGYLGAEGARMHDGAKPDLKESFIWGYQNARGETPQDHPLRGPNRWPAFVPDLEAHAMAFYHHAHRVARNLMRGFAMGLGLDQSFFLRSCARPLSRASFVYYPPQPPDLGENRFGVGPHTDFGVLTVLSQDSVGGLQVQTADCEWIHAPPVDGALVVNVGDLLARWTNGEYRSTPHRVVNRSGLERLSLVLAFDPDADTVIDARGVLGTGAGDCPPPVTCGDYLQWRFAKAFPYRTANTRT